MRLKHISDFDVLISTELNDKVLAAIDSDTVYNFPLDVDINCHLICDNTFYTPLTYAAKNGSLKMIQHILLLGAQVNHHDKKGHTPLASALASSIQGHVKLLLSCGADCHKTPETQWAVLTLFENPPGSILEQYNAWRNDDLLEAFRIDKQMYITTYLEEFADSTAVECIEVLLNHMHDNNQETRSILEQAAYRAIKNPKNLAAIIKRMNDEASFNYLLTIAVIFNQGESCSLLLARITDIAPTCDYYLNNGIIEKLPLMFFAIIQNAIEAVKALCESRAIDINQQQRIVREDKRPIALYPMPDEQSVALIYAIRNDKTEIALYLISLPEVDVNVMDGKLTALQYAITKGNIAVIDALLMRSDINMQHLFKAPLVVEELKVNEEILISILLHDSTRTEDIDEKYEIFLVRFPSLGKIVAARRLLNEAYQKPASAQTAQLIAQAYMLCPTVIYNRAISVINKYTGKLATDEFEGLFEEKLDEQPDMLSLGPFWLSESFLFKGIDQVMTACHLNRLYDMSGQDNIEFGDMRFIESVALLSMNDETYKMIALAISEFITRYATYFEKPYELAFLLLQKFTNDPLATAFLNNCLSKLTNISMDDKMDKSLLDHLCEPSLRHASVIALAQVNLYRYSLADKTPPIDKQFIMSSYHSKADELTLMWNIVRYCLTQQDMDLSPSDGNLAMVCYEFEEFIEEYKAAEIRKENEALRRISVLGNNFSILFAEEPRNTQTSPALTLLNW
jgi:ankyrin repeat protein